MRVKIIGKRSVQELREQLERFIDQVERLGITHVTGTNIYFNPIDETGDEVEIIQADGEVLNGWAYTNPKKTKKAARPAQIVKMSTFREQVEKLQRGFGKTKGFDPPPPPKKVPQQDKD